MTLSSVCEREDQGGVERVCLCTFVCFEEQIGSLKARCSYGEWGWMCLCVRGEWGWMCLCVWDKCGWMCLCVRCTPLAPYALKNLKYSEVVVVQDSHISTHTFTSELSRLWMKTTSKGFSVTLRLPVRNLHWYSSHVCIRHLMDNWWVFQYENRVKWLTRLLIFTLCV